MPMRDAYIPEGALSPDAERDLLGRITDLLLEHEGVHATKQRARALAWVFVHRPETYVGGGPAQAPHYRFICQVPEGQYNDERRAAVVAAMTQAVADAEDGSCPDPEGRVWVFTQEVKDGTWGGMGRVIRLPDIYEHVVGEKGREAAEQLHETGERRPQGGPIRLRGAPRRRTHSAPDLEVEHVVSTSIPGALTKGDVDVLVQVTAHDSDDAITQLRRVQAVHQPHNWTPTLASFADHDAGDRTTPMPKPSSCAMSSPAPAADQREPTLAGALPTSTPNRVRPLVRLALTSNPDFPGDSVGKPAEHRWAVLYDADCGFCTWLLSCLLRWDRAVRLHPIALQRPEADDLLADLTPDERIASWHLISPTGARRSGGAAIPPLLRLTRRGQVPAAAFAQVPRLTDRGYRWVAEHRSQLSKWVPMSVKQHASERVHQREQVLETHTRRAAPQRPEGMFGRPTKGPAIPP
jgi:predicted DCC family thiol-disulfide oxidoreductase YuxK/phenylpyruvate tautomerase PptA (4-oxalocrotonate tautomerase family)